MAQYPQFYGNGGVPFRIEADPSAPFLVWEQHRRRLRDWIEGLDEAAFGSPTRCENWLVRDLVQHLSSGASFLGYTLHESLKGTQTQFLVGLDTQTTVAAATATLDGMPLGELVDSLAKADASIAKQAARHADEGWTLQAEAPPGHMPAHLAISHFFWDSWVHEYDLLLPAGEQPVVDRAEVQVAASYLLALAAGNVGLDTRLTARLSDVDLTIGVAGNGTTLTVTPDVEVDLAPVVEGRAQDIFDRATGRSAGAVEGDRAGLDVLDAMAAVLN